MHRSTCCLFIALFWLTAVLSLFAATGCASYTVPGRAANLAALSNPSKLRQEQTEPTIAEILSRKPLASFPATVAVVRIQSAGYYSLTLHGYGDGAYSVVLSRDVEKQEQLDRIARLPQLQALVPINRLLLPPLFFSDKELRTAAAQVHADMLLIYTFDTSFYDEDMAAGLSVITLGISPNRNISVISTASAILMDTRNGYVYGLAEATERHSELANAWGSAAAIDRTRRETETAAFDKLVNDFGRTWTDVIRQYGHQG